MEETLWEQKVQTTINQLVTYQIGLNLNQNPIKKPIFKAGAKVARISKNDKTSARYKKNAKAARNTTPKIHQANKG